MIGNLFCLPLENLHPPILPGYEKWNAAMEHFVTTGFGSHFKSFEAFGHMDKSAIEANAGLGPLVFLFGALTAGLAVLAGLSSRRGGGAGGRWFWLLRLAPWGALLVFMAKVGTAQIGRHASPYYLLLFPLFLALPGNGELTRRGWWRLLAWGQLLLTALVLIISRERPILPVQMVLGAVEKSHPQWHWAGKIRESFSIRLAMEERKEWVGTHFPAGEKVVGYAVVRGSMEPGMWLPFGSREVYRVLPGETPEDLRARGVHYVIADGEGMKRFQSTPEEWLRQMRGEEAGHLDYAILPGVTNRVYLVHLAGQ